MRINTINIQIVKNLGNYETLRIGAEWTPDSNQTINEAMAAGMAELNATADMLIGKKNAAPAAPAATAAQAAQAAPSAPSAPSAPAAPAAEAEPDALDKLNMEKDGDKRELITLSQPTKFNKTLSRMAAGIAVKKVCEHFRFDKDTLAIVRAMLDGKRVTLSFTDDAFAALVAAVEKQKDIAKICEYIQFADEQTASTWQLALNMCNPKK